MKWVQDSFWGPGNVMLLDLNCHDVEKIVYQNPSADTFMIHDHSVCIFLCSNWFLKCTEEG